MLTMLSGTAAAQGTSVSPNNTNSPYTRYGYGQLADLGSGHSKGMGGVAYALRDKSQINFVNPASYTAVDSLTFIFDGGVSLQNTNFNDGTLKQNAKNSSFDYISMMFRASEWCGISIGLLPYSNIGYNIGEYREDADFEESSESVAYYGTGGLHQLYAGVGFKILKNLSVGANFSYLWGDVTHNNVLAFPNNSSIYTQTTSEETKIHSYKLDIGLQYTLQLDKKNDLTIGAVYSPGHNLNNSGTRQTLLGNDTYGYTSSTTDLHRQTGIPTTIGGGVAYRYDNRLTVAADVMHQMWSDVTFLGQKNALCDLTRVSVGAEMVPNHMGRSYLAHVRYRLGAFYSLPYYKVAGVRPTKEYGVTAGFGFPMWGNRSRVNVSAQYVRTQASRDMFLDENTFRICIGVTFNERWFFKRRVD